MFGSHPSADFLAGEIKRPEEEIGWEGTAQIAPVILLP